MDQQNKTDALEILIILAMFLLIVVVYVPVAIWEDESFYEKESRSRMQNMTIYKLFIKVNRRVFFFLFESYDGGKCSS